MPKDFILYVQDKTLFDTLLDVAQERTKQNVKWGQQNHDDLMWTAILGEEVGEACQEVLTEVWGKENGGGHGDLREELVQVAAVAVAWIEAIDRRNPDA
jgi:hypothetical protein